MNIFNSLGSNYDLKFALKALFAQNKESYGKKLKDFLEKKYQGKTILVYKGREAIGLALRILNLPKESFIAINGFTCYAVYKTIINEGYDAVCLDLENNSLSDRRFWTSQNDGLELNFSANELSKAIKQNPKIKAVIIQNTLGYPCDIEKIAKICKENSLVLIEDLAHSVGTIYKNGKEAGTVGDFVVLSFSQDKIIDAVSGGALVIRNRRYRNVILVTQSEAWRHPESPTAIRDAGQASMTYLSSKQQFIDRLYPLFTFIIRKTYHMGVGKLIHSVLKAFNLLSKPMNESFYTKYDLPNWYCSLVLGSFDNLKKNLEHRKRIVDIYNSMLDKKIAYSSNLRQIPYGIWLRYPIFVENRKSLIEYLKNRRVYVSDIWYDDVDKSVPNCQTAANKILNLPTHRNVSEGDARKIAQKINHFILRASSALQNESRSFATNSSRLTSFARTITSKEEWESFLIFHPEANFLQSWYWGEFNKNLGNDIQRTGFYKNNKLIGVMLSIVEDAKRGRYLTVPGGPIIDWQNSNLVDAFVKEIKRIAREQNCVFVRVRPQLESSNFSKSLFKQHGLINAPMHLHAELTSQLDITKDEQTLFSQMRKTTRYEIKKAISLGIEVTGYQLKSARRYQDLSLIKEFYDLQLATARRQKFIPFSFEFLNEQFKVFSQKNKALLYRAEVNNKLLAEAIIIFYGREAVYHYGGSTDEGRSYPGAYLIQWEAIKEAKKRELTRYNFWGVSPIDKPHHRFSGLSLFKRGFGGQDVEYLRAQDLVIDYPRYIVNYIVESIRKKVRNV